MDRFAERADGEANGFETKSVQQFQVSLEGSESDILSAMKKKSCQAAIRRANRFEVTVEEAAVPKFPHEYYGQLEHVYTRQGLKPAYDERRVESLVRHLQGTGMLLLLRARTREGKCIATGVFPAWKDTAYYWGGASIREYPQRYANEAIQWYAMRYWKARGVRWYDMGGTPKGFGNFKRKFGGQEFTVHWFRKSKYSAVGRLRDLARSGYYAMRKARRRWIATRTANGNGPLNDHRE
jgi:lipid II:glycine glycyltransferase (peptidoglycan interpeptide bridge formation enzyme)